MQRFDL
jgi:hypothetical protein